MILAFSFSTPSTVLILNSTEWIKPPSIPSHIELQPFLCLHADKVSVDEDPLQACTVQNQVKKPQMTKGADI